jgi:hypothetical protein
MRPPREEKTRSAVGAPDAGARVVVLRLTVPASAADPDDAPFSWRGGGRIGEVLGVGIGFDFEASPFRVMPALVAGIHAVQLLTLCVTPIEMAPSSFETRAARAPQDEGALVCAFEKFAPLKAPTVAEAELWRKLGDDGVKQAA